MTKFEKMVNGGRFEKNVIECVIIDLNKDNTFHATINGNSLHEIVKKLPAGYELCVISTLENYFDHKVVNKYEIELQNSQFIYFSNFDELVKEKFYKYIQALETDNMKLLNHLDRSVYRKEVV